MVNVNIHKNAAHGQFRSKFRRKRLTRVSSEQYVIETPTAKFILVAPRVNP
jgi:hypothetical protein